MIDFYFHVYIYILVNVRIKTYISSNSIMDNIS